MHAPRVVEQKCTTSTSPLRDSNSEVPISHFKACTQLFLQAPFKVPGLGFRLKVLALGLHQVSGDLSPKLSPKSPNTPATYAMNTPATYTTNAGVLKKPI